MAQPGARATYGEHVMRDGLLIESKNTTVVSCVSISVVENTILTLMVRHAEVRG